MTITKGAYGNNQFKKNAGESLNEAIDSYPLRTQIESYQMNLYGLPWTTITPVISRVSKNTPIYKKVLGKQMKIVANNGNMNITKEIKFESYEKVKADEKYTLITIPNTGILQKDEKTPVVPLAIKSFEIPKDATISKIEIKSSDKISLGKVEIPAFHSAPQIVGATDFDRYVDLPTDVGVLPTEAYSYRIAKLVDRQIVYVTLYPVVHDANSKETSLYQKFTIDLEYESNILGTVNTLAINKSIYSPTEEGWTRVEIKNMTANNESYTINYQIINEKGEEISSDSTTLNIDANQIIEGDVPFNAPSIPGKYKILLSITDTNDNIIGSEESIFKVSILSLVNFDAPIKLEMGKLSNFEVEIKNTSSEALTAYVSIGIYDGNNLLVRLPQVTLEDIGAGDIIKKQLPWIPDSKISQGIYVAFASIFTEKEKILSSGKKIYLSSNSFDFNQDGIVDKEDLLPLEAGWGHGVGEDEYSYEYDIDLNADIDIRDIMSLVKNL